MPAARQAWMVSSQGLGKWPRKYEVKILSGNPLVVQGSGLGSFHRGQLVSIPGPGTKILQATRCGRGRKKDFHSLKMNLRTMNLWNTWLFFFLMNPQVYVKVKWSEVKSLSRVRLFATPWKRASIFSFQAPHAWPDQTRPRGPPGTGTSRAAEVAATVTTIPRAGLLGRARHNSYLKPPS